MQDMHSLSDVPLTMCLTCNGKGEVPGYEEWLDPKRAPWRNGTIYWFDSMNDKYKSLLAEYQQEINDVCVEATERYGWKDDTLSLRIRRDCIIDLVRSSEWTTQTRLVRLVPWLTGSDDPDPADVEGEGTIDEVFERLAVIYMTSDCEDHIRCQLIELEEM